MFIYLHFRKSEITLFTFLAPKSKHFGRDNYCINVSYLLWFQPRRFPAVLLQGAAGVIVALKVNKYN